MFYRIFAFIFGYNLIRLPKSPAIATMILKKELPIGHMRIDADEIVIDVLTFSTRSVRKKLLSANIEPLSITLCGFPRHFVRYRRRYGVLLGIPIFFAILWLSSLFVWEVHVVGNEKVADETILQELSDLGFSVGSYIPSVDVKTLCNRYLTESDEIAWIAVNIIGTRAEVQVRDVLTASPAEDSDPTPTNLVADCDGLIEEVVVRSGQPTVAVGESVRAGQVLVSGYYQTRNESIYRLEPSRGRILARTTRVYTVNVPINGEHREATGNTLVRKSLLFFGREWGVRDKGSPYEDFDESIQNSQLTLFGRALPVGIAVHIYKEQKAVSSTIGEQEAAAKAEREIAEKVAAAYTDGEILSITKDESCDGIYYSIRWQVYAIEDIARPTPIGQIG